MLAHHSRRLAAARTADVFDFELRLQAGTVVGSSGFQILGSTWLAHATCNMAGLTPQPLAGRRQQLRRRSALLLLAVLALALLPAGVHGAPTLGEETLPANDYLNAEGLPLLMPTNRTTNDHSWYFELPRDPGAHPRPVCLGVAWSCAGVEPAAGRQCQQCRQACRVALAPSCAMGKLVLLPLKLSPLVPPLAPACLPAAGVLVMLHRCGRNAEDFWPPSEVCPQCIGGWLLHRSAGQFGAGNSLATGGGSCV